MKTHEALEAIRRKVHAHNRGGGLSKTLRAEILAICDAVPATECWHPRSVAEGTANADGTIWHRWSCPDCGASSEDRR